MCLVLVILVDCYKSKPFVVSSEETKYIKSIEREKITHVKPDEETVIDVEMDTITTLAIFSLRIDMLLKDIFFFNLLKPKTIKTVFIDQKDYVLERHSEDEMILNIFVDEKIFKTIKIDEDVFSTISYRDLKLISPKIYEICDLIFSSVILGRKKIECIDFIKKNLKPFEVGTPPVSFYFNDRFIEEYVETILRIMCNEMFVDDSEKSKTKFDSVDNKTDLRFVLIHKIIEFVNKEKGEEVDHYLENIESIFHMKMLNFLNKFEDLKAFIEKIISLYKGYECLDLDKAIQKIYEKL